ncbi:MAG: hypothetical protein P4M11_03135 [Candidatus Pacebacteria bacterium]|nr:hypothetical protein [Candidatus Paceibacterota bacterium]
MDGSQTSEGSWVRGKEEGEFVVDLPGKTPKTVQMRAGKVVGGSPEVR